MQFPKKKRESMDINNKIKRGLTILNNSNDALSFMNMS
jgi:hypothetical protein